MKGILILTLVAVASAAVLEPPIAQPVFPEDIRSSRISRIVNGYPANRGQFPHQASVLIPVSETQNVVCGGTIINDNIILTAAHCVAGRFTFRVGVGSTNLQNPIVSIISSLARSHPSYNPTNLNNDIAVIELPIRLTWSSSIQPAQLPRQSQATESFEFMRTYASGFGRTSDDDPAVSNQLMYTYQRVIGNSECAAIYGSDYIRPSTLCGRGWDNNSHNVCQGDSGGPMILYDRSVETTVIGVVSFVSSRGCTAGDPAGYARVTSFLTWISQNAGIQIRP